MTVSLIDRSVRVAATRRGPRYVLAVGLAPSLLLGTTLSSTSPSPDESPLAPRGRLEERLDALVPNLLREHPAVPGLSVGAVESGRFSFAKGYDGADGRAAGARAGAELLNDFASVSKPVTAWGVMRLAQDGVVSLDAPVNDSLRR